MKDSSDDLKIKRGYLHCDFEFFHLKDKKNMEFEFHYHDFNKIIIFMSGKVTYLIEGKAYKLKPWDILFVSSNEVHRPIISPDEPYERIVIWVNSKFLEMHNYGGDNLLACFELALKQKMNLMRLDSESMKIVKNNLHLLGEAVRDNAFGCHILKNSLFLQLIIYLNRLRLGNEILKEDNDIEYDERIGRILEYINENLGENLSLENIAAKFYMNKYYLMHRFKRVTGCTIHGYINQKRILYAAGLIMKGRQITEIYEECGFGDYSSFIRAFKKIFELSPKQYYKAVMEYEAFYLKKYRQQ